MTKRQENCPYCHIKEGHESPKPLTGEDNYDDNAEIDLQEKEIYFDNSQGAEIPESFKIYFCPICGRKLDT